MNMPDAGTHGNVKKEAVKRPFLLTVLCLFSFVFFGMITLLFLSALLWSGSLADMVLLYAPENPSSGMSVLFFTLAGFLLHGSSLAGIILMWRMKRLGYMIFGPSSLVICGYHLFASPISPLTTAVYIGLLFAFGFFLKKLK